MSKEFLSWKRQFSCFALASTTLVALFSGCATSDDVFGNVGENIASPSAMYVNSTTKRLYVVNSNSNVLYDPAEGSVQVFNISEPLAPVLVKAAGTLSFSGEIYLDAAANRAYVPNRYPSNSANTADVRLYNFDVSDEASANFLSATTSQVAMGAFGIECCYPVRNAETGALPRAWITTEQNVLQYVDLGVSLSPDTVPGQISLTTTLDNGAAITNAQANYIAIIGNQAFLSMLYGGIMIVNLDTAGSGGPVPVEYFINDIEAPRGLAVDAGTNQLYVAGEGIADGAWTRYLLVINATKFPLKASDTTPNTITSSVSKNLDSALLATIAVGTGPQEVLLTDAYAFVTNQGDDTVSVISRTPTTWTKRTDIAVGDEPFSLALYRTDENGDGTPDTDKYVYVGNIYSNNLSIIEISSLSVVQTYP